MQKTILNSVLTVAIVTAVGCSNPADNVAEAQVNEPAPPAAPAVASTNEAAVPAAVAPVAAAAKSYAITAESKVDFLASKAIGGETPGGFKKFVGQLNAVGGNFEPQGSKIVIDIGSIYTGSQKLTDHLKNEDFFDVGKFPTATFAATKIESMTEDANKNKVTGDLTMHGVTKSISFPATVSVSDDTVSVKAEFFINRFDFDMKYAGKADNLIRKEVVIKLDVKAAPGAADFKTL